MISYNEEKLLQEAYLSILKGKPSVPSDKEIVTTEPNKVVSAGPVKEIAPGTDTEWHEDEEDTCETCHHAECSCHDSEHHDTTGAPVVITTNHEEEGDTRFSVEDENEEDDIIIDNLHSIRESLLKISVAVATGVHLEPWQQTKLAIVMDNLASIARSIRRQEGSCS